MKLLGNVDEPPPSGSDHLDRILAGRNRSRGETCSDLRGGNKQGRAGSESRPACADELHGRRAVEATACQRQGRGTVCAVVVGSHGGQDERRRGGDQLVLAGGRDIVCVQQDVPGPGGGGRYQDLLIRRRQIGISILVRAARGSGTQAQIQLVLVGDGWRR